MSDKQTVVQVMQAGAEQLREYVISLATNLPRRLYDVVVAGNVDRAMQDTLTRRGVRWVAIEIGSVSAAARRLKLLIDNLRPAIVHSHGADAAAAAVRGARRSAFSPAMLYTAHELSGYESGALSLPWPYRRAYQRMLTSMDRIITLSDRDRQALGMIAPRAAAQAVVVYPGVDTRRVKHLSDPGAKRRRLGLSLEAAVVGTVAELVPASRLDVFLHAAAEVNRRIPNVEFAVVGEGPLRRDLETLAHELGLTGCTAFLGRRFDLPEVLATFNVAVVMTEAAGGVQTALQALSLDLPVVAVDTGGLRELLGELPDVPLVPPGEARPLAAAMLDKLEAIPEPVVQSGGLITAMGLAISERDALVSTEAFDLDEPGLEARDRRPPPRSPGAKLAGQFGVAKMIRHTVALYQAVIEERSLRQAAQK
ncbi:MAG: glycosyltransferase [Armatimonadetes bacterium]|nr:glycosyltransferase [Armatimonadota bacterium]